MRFYWSLVAFQITVSFDETTTIEDVDKLFKVFACGKPVSIINAFSVGDLGNYLQTFTTCKTVFVFTFRSISLLHPLHQKFRL